MTQEQVWDKYQCLLTEPMPSPVTNNEKLVTCANPIWVRSSWALRVLALEDLGWQGTEEFQRRQVATNAA
jgi:hypothetical protein